jgi:hypothetical protein
MSRLDRASVSDQQSHREDRGPLGGAVLLRLAAGPLTKPALCRVVSMVLARANCPVDRHDDAMLICDTLSAHAPDHAGDDCLTFALSASPEAFELRVSGLSEQGAGRLVRDAAVPGVGNVLESTTDGLRIAPSPDGVGEELVLTLVF